MSVENTSKDQFQIPNFLKTGCIIAIVVGLIALLASFKIDSHVGWVDFLVNNLYVITISVSGLFLMCVTGVMQTSWMTPFKRIPESMTRFLPIGFVLMLIVYFGHHTIYEWTHTEMVQNDPILIQKVGYLNLPFFMSRMVFIFAIWNICSWILRRLSISMDTNGWTPEVTKRIVRASAISLILFGFSICFAAFDWIMSIEPHWFSTIFGVYTFAGSFVSGIAFITLTIIVLQKWGYLNGIVTENNLHDLGKWMFGFSTFWAYIWLSQYLLIWYANIPEETEYYVLREHGAWGTLFFVNLIINWTIPFFVLMPRNNKRNKKILASVATLLLVGHFLDLYIMVAPLIFKHSNSSVTGFGFLQLFQALGYLGLLILVVAKGLSKYKLFSKNDPNFAEGAHLHQ